MRGGACLQLDRRHGVLLAVAVLLLHLLHAGASVGAALSADAALGRAARLRSGRNAGAGDCRRSTAAAALAHGRARAPAENQRAPPTWKEGMQRMSRWSCSR